jgi:hypothetical protein
MESAFSNCNNITNIIIPTSVTSIGESAFERCRNIISIKIPESVLSIGERAFSGCDSLTDINVDERNPAFSSVEGVLFNKAETLLVLYPYGRQSSSYTIPASVTGIRIFAFTPCTGLTSIIIPQSVTYIDYLTFIGCDNLKTAVVSRKTQIDYMAFWGSDTEIIYSD